MSIRILIADDHEVVRSGIRSIVANTDIEVVAEAVDGDEVVRLVDEVKPDVVVLDVRMPKTDGLAALGRLKIDKSSFSHLQNHAYSPN